MIAVVLMASAWATPPAEQPALELSYAALLERAVAANPALQLSAIDLRSAEGALLAARGTFDPTLSAGVGLGAVTGESIREFGEVYSELTSRDWSSSLSWFAPTGTTAALTASSTRSEFLYRLVSSGVEVDSEDPAYSTRLGASLSQPLLEGALLAHNLQGVRSAERARDTAALYLELQRQQTLADAANAYWGLWSAQALVDIARQSLAVAVEEARLVKARVDLGELAPIEQMRVDAAVISARSGLAAAERSAHDTSDILLVLIAEPPGSVPSLSTPPRDPVPLTLSAAQVVEVALVSSPTLMLARRAEETARLDLVVEKHGMRPQLDLSGSAALNGYESAQSTAWAETFGATLPEWGVGLDLTVPLANRADRGSLNTAQAAVSRARKEREIAERDLARNVHAQVRALEGARLTVELEQANLRLAEETLRAERSLVAVGRGLQRDVLEAIKGVDDARVKVERARADFQLAIIELERLKGSL